MGQIELRAFGHVELTSSYGGDPDALVAQPKRFALLCYLAIPNPGTMFRRDTLLGVFWPERDIDHARTALRQALAHIRRTLVEEVIVRRGSDEVGLNPDIFWCDVAEFEKACSARDWTKAADLYHGELLQGLFLSRALDFEHWLDAERARLSSMYANAVLELANAATTAGKTRKAVEWWQALVHHDPFDSRYVTGLMEALNRSGDPANALIYARKHRELLKAELEITLPPEVKALERRMRDERSDATAGETHEEETSPLSDPSEPVPQQGDRVAEDTRVRKAVSHQKKKWYRRFVLPGVVVLSTGLALGSWVWRPGDAPPAPNRPAVAVFKLENLGPPEDSAFTLGVTDALITRLSKIGDLRFSFANTSLNSSGAKYAQIAEDFGSTHLLAGTIQREPMPESSGVVRICIQLIQTADGRIVWADDFEVESASLFQMYGEIGAQVAQALDVTLLEREQRALGERPTQNDQAYEYFLVGNAYLEDAFPVRPELRGAVEWYQKAVDADTQFAIAYARLSMAHGGLYWGWNDRSEERLELQHASVEKALRLQPDLPESQLALAIYHLWAHRDYEGALDILSTVEDSLESNYRYLVVAAAARRRLGDFATAARMFAEASDLHPLAFSPALEAGDTYRVLRQYDEAHRYLDRYIAIRPSRPVTYLRKALAYLEEDGDTSKARRVLESGHFDVSFDDMIAAAARMRSYDFWARIVRVLCGNCREALNLMVLEPNSNYQWQYFTGKALLHGILGDSSLERVYHDSGVTMLETMIREEPQTPRLHSDLGLAYAELGNAENAIREANLGVELALARNDRWSDYGRVRTRAEVYAILGMPDSAIADLELLFSTLSAAPETGRYIDPVAYVPLMRIDPIWDPIRDHPGFQELLVRYDPLTSAS